MALNFVQIGKHIGEIRKRRGLSQQKLSEIIDKSPTYVSYIESGLKCMLKYFSSKRGLSHYLSMAGGNYREYLKGDMVKAKKYFYVLRPILACRWILDQGTPPPMLFSELVEAELDPALLPDVDRLLELKMSAPEIKTIPRIESINRYLDSSIEELRSRIVPLPEDTNHGWEDLNRLFFSQLR